MPLTMEHEAPIELCREHPEVVPALLQRILKVPLPYYSRPRVVDPATRAVIPTGQRSDVAVLLEDNGRAVLGAILEPQGRPDPDKWFAWPKYTADLHAEIRCDTYLIVLALSRSVAAWAREPIRSFQPGHGLRPYVIGPDDLPHVHSVAEARAEPWLAALSAMVHANDRGGEQEVLHVLQVAKEDAGEQQAWWLYHLFYAIMSPRNCELLQEIIMMHPDAYLPKTKNDIEQFNRGKSEGETKGLRTAITLACKSM